MTTERLRPELPEEEDSWAGLAEDLFGIDFAKVSEEGEFVPPEDLLTEDDRTTPDSPEPETTENSQTAGVEESPSPATFGEEEVHEPELSSENPPEIDTDNEAASTQEQVLSGSKQTREDDTFWDVLNDWNWEENKARPSKKESAPEEKGRSRDRSITKTDKPPVTNRIQREEGDFSTAADFRDEYIEDDGFGAGLLEEEADIVKEPELSLEKDKSPGDDETRAKPRRSRRRRRPGKTRSEPAETETDSKEERVVENREDAEESGDEKESSSSDTQKRSSRSRSSRRRRKPTASKDIDRAIEPAGEFEEGAVEDHLEPDVDLETAIDSEESEAREEKSTRPGRSAHRDVPTWEEAISYLLSPPPARPRESESETKPNTTAKKEASTSTTAKPPARRRRRRRR